MRKIFHLHIESLNSDYYYGDLTILYTNWGHFFDVSKSTLEKYDFEKPYEKQVENKAAAPTPDIDFEDDDEFPF